MCQQIANGAIKPNGAGLLLHALFFESIRTHGLDVRLELPLLGNFAQTNPMGSLTKVMGYPSGWGGLPDGLGWVSRWVQNGFKSHKSFR